MNLQSGKEILNPAPPKISKHFEEPKKEESEKEDEGRVNEKVEKEKTLVLPPFP
jgi:hypothetical protein